MAAKTSSLILSAIVALTGAALQVTSAAAEPAASGGTFETCLRAVNILGASMGHSEVKDANGHASYKFDLRTSGANYVVTCDAQTGIVKDVSPRRAEGTGPL